MGLVLPQTVKVKTNGSNCKYFREKGYEFKKCGEFIEVNVLDLKKGSTIKVKYKCDFCGKETEVLYGDVVKAEKNNIFITCKDKSCTQAKYKNTCKKRFKVEHPAQCQKIKDKTKTTCQERFGVDNPNKTKEVRDKIKVTCQEKYGIDNPSKSQEIKDKIKAINQEKHGVDWYVQSKEFKDKSKITNKKKYGAEYCSQVQEVKDKVKATCQKRFGVDHPSKSQKVKDKVKATCQKRFGVDNPMQCDEIRDKSLETFQFNGTGPCSRAQKYIQILTNGILNKPLCGFLTDIYFEDQKMVLEHDGSGHFLTDMFKGNKTPSKEALLKEKEREDKIINNGYKMIRFLAKKDRIPSDEVILSLVDEFKNLNFKVARIDFEKGIIEKDYSEKTIYDFGKLRKITKEDLEEIENEKNNKFKTRGL